MNKTYRFSVDEMEDLKLRMAVDPIDGLVQVWHYVLGKPLSEFDGDSINPSDYAIYGDQLESLLASVPEAQRSAMAMEFVNVGPRILPGPDKEA